MNIASAELTCVAVLGGSWNGIGIDGFECVMTDERGDIRSFTGFKESVQWVIEQYPYVHFDSRRDQLSNVTDDPKAPDEPSVEIKKMVMPGDEALRNWYDAHASELAEAKKIDDASDELVRVCVLGGEWNSGCSVDGCDVFSEADTYDNFEKFASIFEAAVRSARYVHYDENSDRVVLVSDDECSYEPGGEVRRYDLEVLRLTIPDEATLREWYEALSAAYID